jgi:hypothetical protein
LFLDEKKWEMKEKKMKIYNVWYRKEPTYWFDKDLKVTDISIKYCPVGNVQAGCLDEVFEHRQSEVWSPKFKKEMTDLIQQLGLSHTSMSVGDVAEVNGNYYQLDLSCWRSVN